MKRIFTVLTYLCIVAVTALNAQNSRHEVLLEEDWKFINKMVSSRQFF